MLGAEDWALYRRVRLEALREAPYAFGSTYAREKDRSEADWRHAVRTRTRFIAEVDGAVVGTSSGGDGDASGAAALTAMWVDPGFRRQGIGDALVQRVIEWARQTGYGELFLWVVDGNGSAERLYERNGFRRTGAAQEVRPGELEYEMSRSLR
ncbi:MAG TPA: GNAT family N-acetyltransferase [Candidatus Dormibacteraeota bacterium]|nr:GNAT family N-acetyltransferase [Candidatus Dormibacteraeota bacterium]